MYKQVFLLLIGGLFFPIIWGQQINFQSHQKYVYTDESSYTAQDMIYANGELVLAGSFFNNGAHHPIATKFNSKGEFAKDLYWDQLNGVLEHVNKINDTCLHLNGGTMGQVLFTLANPQLVLGGISNYKDYKNYSVKLLASHYNTKAQMVQVLTESSDQVRVQTITGNGQPTEVILNEHFFPFSAYFSNTGKTLYLVSYYPGDFTAKIIKYDVSDPLKPLYIGSASNVPFREFDFITKVTDDGCTIIANAYETSEPDAEQITFTTDRKIITISTHTTVDFAYLEMSAETSFSHPETFRRPDYICDFGSNQYMQIWVGGYGVYAQVLNANMEEISHIDYALPDGLVPLLTKEGRYIKTKMLDEKTMGVLYPYAPAGNELGKINTWELFTFTVQ
jgi:hypothetical protein